MYDEYVRWLDNAHIVLAHIADGFANVLQSNVLWTSIAHRSNRSIFAAPSHTSKQPTAAEQSSRGSNRRDSACLFCVQQCHTRVPSRRVYPQPHLCIALSLAIACGVVSSSFVSTLFHRITTASASVVARHGSLTSLLSAASPSCTQ